ncbi:hypothetical protein M153_708000688 [Pseudoloma neurophilia]|uniref:Uncharacterized protein n=1 Tax=Pseudoloma neurophilia TaxID=146866 RepID=A0A0R0LW84_9MICR|nr:hypothetical protein M153_708000688 [Pseudoloma neurophilia]
MVFICQFFIEPSTFMILCCQTFFASSLISLTLHFMLDLLFMPGRGLFQ